MTEPGYIAEIEVLKACSEAVDWLREKRYPTLQDAWDACERGDWMLWLWGKTAGGEPMSDERKPLVLAAVECARLGLPLWESRHPDDRRPHEVLDLAERWARDGDVSEKELRTAYAARPRREKTVRPPIQDR